MRSNTVYLVGGIECRTFEFRCVESVDILSLLCIHKRIKTIWHTQMRIRSCFVRASDTVGQGWRNEDYET